MDVQESKWCPECEKFVLHLKGWCVVCDLEQEDWHDKSVQEVLDSIGVSGVDWMEKDWIVVLNQSGPQFSASTKKECVEWVVENSEARDGRTKRVESGLYVMDDRRYWVGRPEAFEESGFEHMLTQDSDSNNGH